MTDDAPAYTIPQVAKKLQIGKSTVWKRIQDGTIPVFHIGSSTRVHPAVVEAIMRGERPCP